MSWEGVDPRLRALIERVCTTKEIEVLKLKAAGYGLRPMARILGISRSSVRSRLDAASQKIAKELGQ
jgi:DNA-binding CsgD family transcriptional regulator